MLVTLANIMLRQARKTTNARQYLDDIVTQKFTTLNTNGGQFVSGTVNGKSWTLQVPSGVNLIQFAGAAELALGCLEHGLDAVPRSTMGVVRGINGGYGYF